MADNVQVTPGSGATIAADDIGGVQHQRVKVQHGADGAATDVSAAAPLPVRQSGATAAAANVTGAITEQTLAAALATRIGLILHNDSTATLYLKYGTGVTTTSYTYKILPDVHWEMPGWVFTGVVTGVWSDADGAARVTEVSP